MFNWLAIAIGTAIIIALMMTPIGWGIVIAYLIYEWKYKY